MVEVNNKTKSKINSALVKKIAEQVLILYKKPTADLSIAFVGDRTISRLNKQYRDKDGVTDVLSFADNKDSLGEIVIDFQQIKRQSKKFSKSVNEELVFILVHGILHLLGHDDDTEEKRLAMIKLGEEIIKQIKKIR